MLELNLIRNTVDKIINEKITKGMKASYEKILESNEIELNSKTYKIEVAEVEACTAMLMNDKCNKVKERENYQNNLNKLKINYHHSSIEIKKKQTEFIV